MLSGTSVCRRTIVLEVRPRWLVLLNVSISVLYRVVGGCTQDSPLSGRRPGGRGAGGTRAGGQGGRRAESSYELSLIRSCSVVELLPERGGEKP